MEERARAFPSKPSGAGLTRPAGVMEDVISIPGRDERGNGWYLVATEENVCAPPAHLGHWFGWTVDRVPLAVE